VWKPFDTVPRNRKIVAWHVIWNCPVTIEYRPDFRPITPWLDGTKTNTWPENAFSHWDDFVAP